MRHHTAMFERVRKRTGMYLRPETYAVVAAFVSGYDEACEGGTLCGFKEWLVLRLKSGSNLHWPALVLVAAFPDAENAEQALSSGPQAERHAIDTLFDLLSAFEEVRAKHDGLRQVFLAYAQWERDERVRC